MIHGTVPKFGGDYCWLIIPGPTGFVWSNQTDGVCCSHPEAEGLLVRLDGTCDGFLEDSGEDYFGDVAGWLVKNPLLAQLFDAQPNAEFREAWVPLYFKGTTQPVILTYLNSD